MILNIDDQTTQDIYDGIDSRDARRIPRELWVAAVRKLDVLNAAISLQDLRVPPANRLKKLKGTWSGYYSIRINDQYRIVFRWSDGNAKDVVIADYH